jgi:hypothetical protein
MPQLLLSAAPDLIAGTTFAAETNLLLIRTNIHASICAVTGTVISRFVCWTEELKDCCSAMPPHQSSMCSVLQCCHHRNLQPGRYCIGVVHTSISWAIVMTCGPQWLIQSRQSGPSELGNRRCTNIYSRLHLHRLRVQLPYEPITKLCLTWTEVPAASCAVCRAQDFGEGCRCYATSLTTFTASAVAPIDIALLPGPPLW